MLPALAVVSYTIGLPGSPEQIRIAKAMEPDILEVSRIMDVPGVDVPAVYWTWCGEENAAYNPTSKNIVLCYELTRESVGAVRFVLAHEYSHAIIEQLDLPIVGSEESAADELAAVAFSVTDHQNDILSGAIMFKEHISTPPDFDPHPPNDYRAHRLMCLEDGSEDHPQIEGCSDEYARVKRNWLRLLGAAIEQPDA